MTPYEKRLADNRAWYRRNREKRLWVIRKWRVANRERINAVERERRRTSSLHERKHAAHHKTYSSANLPRGNTTL